MKYMKKSIIAFLCLALCLLSACGKEKIKDPVLFGKTFPVNADTDISIEDCFLYSGEFVEDGSFEEKTDVAAIKVKNNSDKDIQLIRIYATTTEKELFFEITTLPAGATVIALEKDAQTIVEKEEIKDFRVENRVDFAKDLSLYENVFLLQANNATINIKNISDKEIGSDIYVYYKKKDADGNYLGGITFRTKATGGLKPEAIAQLPASSFNLNDSEVLFVDYAG